MVAGAQSRFDFVVDAQDRLEAVSPAWLAFAQENGAPELTSDAVLGQRLFDFVAGESIREVYRALFHRLRRHHRRIVVPFRCDSPTLRRHMLLEMHAGADDRIRMSGMVVRVQPTAYLRLLDPQQLRSQDSLRICSSCKRAYDGELGWLELEDATARLHLLEHQPVPQLQYEFCRQCADTHQRAAAPIEGSS